MKFAASLSKLFAAMRAPEPSAHRATAVTPAPLIVALEPRIVYDASAASIGAAVAASHHQASAAMPAARDAATAPAAAPSFAVQSEMAAAAGRAVGSTGPMRAVHGYTATNGAATAGDHGVSAQGAIVVPRQGEVATASVAGTGDTSAMRAVHGFTDAVASGQDTQVVFINSNVSDYQTLIAGLPQGTQYVILDSTKDGLAQIEQYVQQHPGVSAIHLVSHGADGQVQVGSTWLNEGDLSAYSTELAQIGAAVKPGADFLIYGCDVAQNADGKAFVQQIASISGLNVAASTDATGASSLGGDWTLEYDAGAVHTPVIFSTASEQQYGAVLAVTDETYDSELGYVTPGGATGVTSFSLGAFTYTMDQSVEFAVDSTTTNQGGTPPLTTGPTDGVLFGNVQGTQLTSMTMKLTSGDKMAVQSFDVDTFGGAVAVEGLNSSGVVVASLAINGSTTHVDLSSNAGFAGITSLRLRETDGFFLTPTLNNFTYVDLSSPPVVTASGGSTSFVEADNVASTPVAIDSAITLTDGDATTAKQGTVSITGNFVSGQDVLAFANTNSTTYGDISASYSSGTGVLTLTSSGTATIAQWQNAFRAVTYTDTAVSPSTATRTMSFALTSDAYFSSSNTTTKNVSVTATDQTPIVHTTGGTTTYGDGSSAVTIDSAVTVSDLDNTTQSSGTVSISGGFHSGDTLNFTNDGSTMGNISASYNAATGVLTLTSAGATATDAQWGHALSAVTFSSTSPTYGSRTISFATSDGTKTSTAATDTVNVVNPLQLTADSGSAAFVSGDNTASTPVTVDSGLTVTDSATGTLSSATVTITGNFTSGEDFLQFANDGSTMGNITAGSFNQITGTLTLTSAGSTATLAQWRSALDSIKYTDVAVTPNALTRTVSFTAVDSLGNTSSTVSRNVTVTATDQTPIVGTTGGTTSYVGASSAVTVDAGVTVSDLDNTTQSSGTVSVSAGFHSGDTLGFTNDGSTMGNISASYNAATGVLTLTSAGATATVAQWTKALSAVTFSSTSTTYGSRTISFATSDGTKTSTAAPHTVNMTAPPAITTDGGSAAFVAGDNTTSTPVVIDSGLTVTDGSATTLASATVAITGGFSSGHDVLSFTNDGSTMGNITASYNGATGVMTLTSSGATATLAQWQSALDAVKYTDTAVTPSTTTRTISFTAVDGAGNPSATATRTVSVTDTDQTPIVTTTGGTTSYVGASSGVTIDGNVTVSDRDNSTQTSATVAVTTGFQSGDVLSFTNDGSTMGNIQASYSAGTGVLLLTSIGGTATNAQWASALSSVTFSSTSTTYGNRTIWFQVNDGTKNSAQAADTINMTAPPVVTTDSGSAAFVAGDNTTSTPVTIDSGLTVTDGSAATLSSATVAITGNFHGAEDVLAFTNDGSTMGNITASYNTSTGVMTLTSSGATATLAQWQRALDAVTYTDTAVTPNNATRTISFTAVDGGGNTSATATRTVMVTDTDQTPIVTTTGGTTNYVGGTSAATIDGGITVSDLDNTTQSSGTVSISGGFHSGDTLTFVNTSSATFGNVVGSYNSATGVLTLTSSGATATDAQWANALSAVTFSASASATPGNRTVSFAVSDGTKTSALKTDTVTVLGPPAITTDSGSAAFVAGDNTASTPVAIDSGLTLTDGTAPTLASATVSITGNFHSAEDVLAFTNSNATTFGNIAASYNAGTGVLTLTSSGATATLAQWQAALDAVTYTDTAVTPNNATRTISFAATDTGAYTSNTATRTVTVTDTDQTPIVTTTGGTTNYVGGTSAVAVNSGITVSDLDNTTQSSGTVSITTGFHSGDTLTFVNTSAATFGNVVGSYNSATGVLTLTSSGATASDAQWANALSAVTFSASATATPGNRTISFVTNDGTTDSAAATHTVDLLAPPTITTDSGSASFVAGDNTASTPVTIDSGLSLTDGGAPTLASATVAITGNFHSGEDVLAFTNSNATTFGNIAASYNAGTGVLTLTSSGATATLAQWQAALDAVTYTDTAVTPNTATRTISFAAIDTGANTSNTATRTVTVTDTDQTPIVTTTGGTASYVTGAAGTIVNPNVSVTDLDNATQSSGTVSITGNFHSGEDALSFTNTNAAAFGNISGTFNAATGVLTLTSSGATATDAQWANALSAVTFSSSGTHFGNRTVSFATSDGTKTSVAADATVSFVDKPHVTLDSGAASFVAADNTTSTPVAVAPGLTLADASTTLSSASVAITGGFHPGQDVLAFANDGATMGNIAAVYDANSGVLTLSSAGGTASLAQWRSALASVTYTDTAVKPDNATRTISFTVTDGNGTASDASARSITVTDTDQTPTLAIGGNATFTSQAVGSTPVAVAPQVSVGDRDATATLTSAQVKITGGFDTAHDTLALASGSVPGGFTASYDASTGVLTLTSSSATLAQWQSALQSVTYSNSQFRATGTRTLSYTISDGVKTSTAATNTVTIVAGPSGGTPVAALPVTPATTVASPTPESHAAGSDNTAPPDVLDELSTTRTVGAVPSVPTMTFSDPSAPATGFSLDRATVSRFDASALNAALAPAPAPQSMTSFSELALSVPQHDPFSIDVATLLPPTQSMGGGMGDVTVRLADGRSLPGWLHYDAASGALRGKVPAGVQDVRIVVEVRDAAGHVARRDVVLAPHARDAGHGLAHPNQRNAHPSANSNGHADRGAGQPLASRAARPVGKPSLDQQFAQARAALHVARPGGAVRRV
ncbi:hypothetical protein C0Z18_02435 [Trinickia dabaoshanensis]|uniref:DUF4347 domain-containing protein n=1 Tax=Trinickia dabaoshanensis TaxID=564714 RepID=A0A2N7W102_9BURK|nr:DUF4347 domain-containing protein [Trinickia dabaoshanensis]PMS23094.1 hypothetical protein C0Z18_02435 [Trinickia dabaoshanensis]